MSRQSFLRVATGVYERVNADGVRCGFYERVTRDGLNTFRKLPARTRSEAADAAALNRVQFLRFKAGLPGVPNPYLAPKDTPLQEIVDRYILAGCPGRGKTQRSDSTVTQVKEQLAKVLSWASWKDRAVETIDANLLDNYVKWRRERGALKNGRTLDLEIMALNGVLRWAAWKGLIVRNPLSGLERPSFQEGSAVNCRDCRPVDAEELHDLARKLFLAQGQAVLGWQLLFEAFTGLRTSEALACRWDAAPGQPGFIDGDVLHVKRAKHGVNPYVRLHPAAAALVRELRRWCNRAYPQSPYFFPSVKSSFVPVNKHALADALKDLTPERRTSHGLRAYYVTARRSEGTDDRAIAAEIGDKMGATIIERVYGGLPPNWFSSNVGKINWVPAGEPAWAVFCGSTVA